jgi:hypothetical protein
VDLGPSRLVGEVEAGAREDGVDADPAADDLVDGPLQPGVDQLRQEEADPPDVQSPRRARGPGTTTS